MILGLLAALAATLAFGTATVMTALASRRLGLAAPGPRLLLRLVRSPPYLAGMVLDAVGFVATLLALRVLPLFVVQSAVAASIGVTALVAARALADLLGRREVVLLAALGLGLVLVAASASARGAEPLSRAGQWALLVGACCVAALAIPASRAGRRTAVLLAAAAGLGAAAVAIAARALTWPPAWPALVVSPLTWTLAAGGLTAMTSAAAALQRGAVTVVAGVSLSLETLVPAAVGYLVLGDRARPGLLPLAAAGLVLTLLAAVGLARHGPA